MQERRLASIALIIILNCLPAFAQVLVRDIPANSATANALTWDGEAFWVGDNTANIIRVSIEDGEVLDTVVSPVAGSDGLAWDGEYLWTISAVLARQWIYKIDTETGLVVDSIADPTAGRSGGMVWHSNEFWMSRNFPGDSLLRTDSDGVVLQRFPTPGTEPRGVAHDGTHLWNSSVDTDADRIYWLNSANGATLWSFVLPEHDSQPNRRMRGIAWVDGYLWVVAYAQHNTEIRLHQYDVSNAVSPDIEIEQTSHNFGETVFGVPVQWQFDIMNVGNVTLTLDSAGFTNGIAYIVDEPLFPAGVEAGSLVEMRILFDPPGPGVYDDTLLIYSDDPDEPVIALPITGVCLSNEGVIEVEPSSIDFGDVWVAIPGWSSGRTVEIRNIGFGDLTVSNIQISIGDGFFLDPVTLPVVIDSQGVYTARVWFDPNLPAFYDGILTITSDDSDNPTVDIPLQGTANTDEFDQGESFWQYLAEADGFDNGINAVTWIDDTNGDDAPDVIASSGNGRTYCINGTSSGVADTFWTFNTRANPNHSGVVYYDRALTTIQDLDGDDRPEVIIGTAGGSRSVYALSGASGEEIWMYDTRDIDGSGGWVNAVLIPGDLNGDLVDDVVAAVGTPVNMVIALDGEDGDLLWEGPDWDSFYSLAAIADVTEDGVVDIVGGTVGYAIGINGATGDQIWQASVAQGSPVFDVENMGNANPAENTSEDVVVASAYFGVYSRDGLDGSINWLVELQSTVYEVAVGSDLNADGVREVYAGLVNGQLLCLDGFNGEEIWQEIPDPSSENILSLMSTPDVTGDGIEDIVCGTLGDYLVVLEGWDGQEFFSTLGDAQSGPVDAIDILPDIDGNNSWEILSGNREGVVQAFSGGNEVLTGEIAGNVREFSTNVPIQNARVWVEGGLDTMLTDAQGNYNFFVEPGTYTLTIAKQGYCEETFTNIAVEDDETEIRNANLRQPNAQFDLTSINLVTPQGQNVSTDFEISNPTTATICPLDYEITDNADWLSVTPDNGSVPNGGAQQIIVNANVAGLPVGDYDAIITVNHNDTGSPTNIPVTLSIALGTDHEAFVPTEFAFYQNYPNPFNATTSFVFDVAAESRVVITLFNVMGQEAAKPVDAVYPVGRYSYTFNAANLSSGMYLMQMHAGDFSSIRKMILMK